LNKLTNKSIRSIRAKKVIFIITAMSCLFILGCMSASALNTNVGAINYSNFISKTETVLKTLLILIGAGLALWGVVNLIEGYGNDNPGAKSQGIKQTMGGIGIILIGVILVPVLGNLMTSAMSN
jgi:hypothetical protein